MKCPLAILVPDPIGTPANTFIRRYVCDLLPGGTAVIAPAAVPGAPSSWSISGPFLDVSRVVGGRLRWQVAHGVARQFGVLLDHVMVRRFLERHQVEVVLSQYLDFSWQWIAVARDLGLPFFVHAHGDDYLIRPSQDGWRERYLDYRAIAGIVANSRNAREVLVSLGLDAAKIHVAPCGVDVPAEPLPHPARTEIRCVAVGRMVHQKAPVLLLDSFRRAAELCPNLRLDFMGDGPLLPAAEEYVRAFRLHDKVTLHGLQFQDSVIARLRQSDLLIQHSLWEGLGVSILEAMAQALPVVATSCVGIVETMIDGITGYLTEPGDSAAMADRIVVLARDPELRRRMGLAGFARVRDHFTWERERADLLRILGLESAAA